MLSPPPHQPLSLTPSLSLFFSHSHTLPPFHLALYSSFSLHRNPSIKFPVTQRCRGYSSLFPLPPFIIHTEILAHIPSLPPSHRRLHPRIFFFFFFTFQPPRHLNDSTLPSPPRGCALIPSPSILVLTVSLHIESDTPPYVTIVCVGEASAGREMDMHWCTANEQTLIVALLVSSVKRGEEIRQRRLIL